uniref:Aquaporin n=1 Tax=Entomoneis paludosa TaxID=265537 RepID=A0A6U3A8R8_9STRA|mmetsp:Transcript_23707/g.49226  ORF Transcript_23707/g.49226 Transcript_23707/m.49226 type:complete len:282 (+) Transcript_23707:93-938(+)|eukprot:CAMPEP_0172440814 /NCGR_PEP_ID=MMETSP1065-20121228/1431_1 /TAXON_ID=265537 /ORGANISM="Amphiprora paludosa, Strain CCMP125" /LENGTH=281 /DNA_ID=CAMNT_0013189865 /DNA_START=52 /DNA_END=897 /DNA_ORIENTATION=-
MVKNYVEAAEIFFKDLVGYVPPGMAPAICTAFIEGGKYFTEWRNEFIGTLLMVVCTFSAGKWIGQDDMNIAWLSHAAGVVAADYFGGGQHVNPAVTMSMWALGKCSYTESYVRVSGQMAGGLVAFPLFHAVADALQMPPFGGPEFNTEDEDHSREAFLSEFGATFLLLWVVYLVNWEINFGTYHYLIKQTLTAAAVRALIEFFPTAGPAINPMLATTWAVWGSGDMSMPSHFMHYFVYWASPCLAAVAASIIYVIYAGGTIFGSSLPIGPFKGKSAKVKKH